MKLKSNGFLDKRAAIATIGDQASNDIDLSEQVVDQDEENLEDFIPNS